MATVSGNATEYVNKEYIVDQTDYVRGEISLSLSASVTGTVTNNIVNASSITWADCGTWATWEDNQWLPRTDTNISLTTAVSGNVKRGGTASADISLTTATTGNAIFGPTVQPDISLTATSTGNCTFSATATPSLAITTIAVGGKKLFGTATPSLALTSVIDALRKRGSPCNPQLSITASSDADIVKSGVADAVINLTASALAHVKFFGTASANLNLTLGLTGGLVLGPANPNTTFAVESETRVYPVLSDAGHANLQRIFEIEYGESRIYPVTYEDRTTTIESETRKELTEIY